MSEDSKEIVVCTRADDINSLVSVMGGDVDLLHVTCENCGAAASCMRAAVARIRRAGRVPCFRCLQCNHELGIAHDPETGLKRDRAPRSTALPTDVYKARIVQDRVRSRSYWTFLAFASEPRTDALSAILKTIGTRADRETLIWPLLHTQEGREFPDVLCVMFISKRVPFSEIRKGFAGAVKNMPADSAGCDVIPISDGFTCSLLTILDGILAIDIPRAETN